MGPVNVVVLDVLVDYDLEMPTTEDKHPVKTLTPDRADEAFGVGVGTRCTDWRTNDPNALGTEDLVEAGRELGVPVPDQELDRLCTLG